jgi:hypothetical protein
VKHLLSAAALSAALACASAAHAGKVYLTGHDPDYHSQAQVSGKVQLNVALKFVTGDTYKDGSTKFLWVESHDPIIGGHLRGYDGLAAIGVTSANVDWVDAAGLATVDFSKYSAIAIASTFGGMTSAAEIDELIARKGDIKSFVNGGGGLAAFAECIPSVTVGCDSGSYMPADEPLFGFLPISTTSVGTSPPYHVTSFGAGLGLTDFDVSDCCTHNSFSSTGGLKVVDFDSATVPIPTTLAGDVKISDGGFTGVPEPGTWTLMLLGFGGLGAVLRSRRREAVGG